MVGEQKRFYFLSFLFGWEWKSGRIEKVSLYKFTHIPLLKNDAQLKPKKGINNHTHTHTKQSPKFIKKNKNHVQKKNSHLKKKQNHIKKNHKRKQKKKEKKKRQCPRGKKKKKKMIKDKKMNKSNVDKAMCNCTLAFLSKNDVQIFPSIFSPFWGENFLVGSERKYLG